MTSRWRALEDKLARLLPRPLARLVLLELRLWMCLAQLMTRRHDGRRPNSYPYHGSIHLLLVVGIALTVLEGALVEVVVAVLLPGTPWPWVAVGLHLYGLSWIVTWWASLVTRPHLITRDALYVRDGATHEIIVSHRAILRVVPARAGGSRFGRTAFAIDGRHRAVVAYGDPTVTIHLDINEPVEINGNPTSLAMLSITVDDEPVQFAATLGGFANAATARVR